ncbi:MAG: prohibitin family protein [Victivallales bacterium]|nr:prohibitin family protein [Victivallales bacterium]
MLFIIFVVLAAGAMVSLRSVRDKNSRTVSMACALAFVVGAVFQTVSIVPAGHVGVIDVFGKVSPRILQSGINFRNPFAKVVLFSVKTQEIKELMNVPSQEGLTISLEMSILYHLSPEKAADVYRTVGVNYLDVILIPQFRSVARSVTSSFEAKALYTSEREILIEAIRQRLVGVVAERGVNIEATPLRSIKLPARLTQAIEQKLESEQESQRMEFVLLKEQKEAERKRIEAQGIADFQLIVTKGISEQLLKWKGIEATEKLASSNNTKIVIIGGADGLPIILNTEK